MSDDTKTTEETYTKEEAMEDAREEFGGEIMSADTWLEKYSLQLPVDEVEDGEQYLETKPQEMWARMAKEGAKVEEEQDYWEQQFYNVFEDFTAVPQGSIMFALGNEHQKSSLSNCFVLPIEGDSLEDIFETAKRMARTYSYRGGVGTDLTILRPKDSVVHNAARQSTGAVSFMDFYSYVTNLIGQNSRRGALMETISDKHPDLYHPEADGMDFINIKRDLDKVTGANISVKFSDAFMEAVKNDEQWVLKWERVGDEIYVGEGRTREFVAESEGPDLSVRREYPAQDIWDNVVESATECAEPGVIFWDKMKNDPPYGQYEEHEPLTTNPCQPGWASIMTENGLTKMEEIEEGDEVWSKEGWSEVNKKWDNGVQDVYQYVTTAGTFYGTEDHEVEDSGNKVAVKDAEFIDLCDGPNVGVDPDDHDDQLIMDGLVLGDGGVAGGQSKIVVLHIGEDDQDYFDSDVSDLIGNVYSEEKKNYKVDTTVVSDEVPAVWEREVPDRFKFADKVDVASVLRGIYTANGSICGNRVTLKSSSIDFIRDVQDMLQSIGIRSYYTTNKPSKVDWHNGTYESRESYDLNISSHRDRFYSKVGFIQDYKMDKLKNILNSIGSHRKNSYPIVEKQKISKEKVYDIEVDNDSHTYCTNGLSVSNCSEIPLSPNDACTLLSINLTNFVKHPFSESAEIDYDSLKSVARIATRFLDNIKGIDAEDVPFEEQREAALQGRRLGLGTHGLGDMLAMLEVKYDSDEAKEICDELYKKYKHFIYEASADLAEEKGTFPTYDYGKHMSSPFMKRLANENAELADKIKEQGLRNCGLLTCAPTGSVSMISQTSSGIEPIFRLKYKRNVRTGDEMKTFDVFHHLVQDYLDKEGIDIDPETTTEEELKEILPDYFQTAETIDHPKRAELQGVLQRHIDHSISSTINIPADTDNLQEVVSDSYFNAFEAGTKGYTCYISGSREDSPLETGEQEPTEVSENMEFKADTRVWEVGDESGHYFVISGQDQLFINGYSTAHGRLNSADVELGDSLEDVLRGNVPDEKLEKYVRRAGFDPIEKIARLTSLALKSENAKLVKSCFERYEDRSDLAGMLDNIFNYREIEAQEQCPECGEELIHKDGCVECSACHYSRCGV